MFIIGFVVGVVSTVVVLGFWAMCAVSGAQSVIEENLTDHKTD